MALPRQNSVAFAATLTLAACGGSDGGPTDVDDPGPIREVKADPSFASDIVEIFGRVGCTASQCHGGGQGGLTLTASASVSYGNLVNVPSAGESGEIRVIPGDAQNSYLVKKLEGRQSVGAQMPLTGSIDNIDLQNIRNWIDQGAKNN